MPVFYNKSNSYRDIFLHLTGVGTLPSEDTWHASCRDTWHASCRDTWHASYSDTWHTLSSGSPSSGSSYKSHMRRFSHPDCLKEEQTTFTKHRHPDGFRKCVHSTIHPDNQHGLSGYDCPDH